MSQGTIAYYTNTFNISVSPNASDPFDLSSNHTYSLWRGVTNTSWIWLNQSTGAVVYLQEYRTDVNQHLVYHFPGGGLRQNPGVSPYNFNLFKCLK